MDDKDILELLKKNDVQLEDTLNDYYRTEIDSEEQIALSRVIIGLQAARLELVFKLSEDAYAQWYKSIVMLE